MVPGLRRRPASCLRPTLTRPSRYRRLHRRCAPGGSSPATTSARAAWRSPSPRWPSPAASAPSIDRYRRPDPTSALFSESTGRFVVRGRRRRRRVARRATRRAASPCSARSPTTADARRLAGGSRTDRASTTLVDRVPERGGERRPRPATRASRPPGTNRDHDVALRPRPGRRRADESRCSSRADRTTRGCSTRRKCSWSPAASATPTRSARGGCWRWSSRHRRSATRCAAFVAARQAGDRDLQRVPGAHRAPGCCPARSATTPSGRFHCEWVDAGRRAAVACIWTAGIDDDRLPDRPRRGPLRRTPTRRRWPPPARSRCATPARNPNGSVDDIAGVCDATGSCSGLMPHPENHVDRPPAPAASRRRDADAPATTRAGAVRAGRPLRQGALMHDAAPF